MRLVVDISAHGFGHLAQVTPVLQELRQRLPSLHLVIRTALPHETVLEFLGGTCEFAPPAPDIGLIMHGPHRVNKKQSIAAYQKLHKNFSSIAADQARQLENLNADLLLSNVSYTGLAGAALLTLPAIALCSFHWGEAVTSYLSGEPGIDAIADEISTIYNSATTFLLAAPRKSISGLLNIHHIGPLASQRTY